MGLGVDSSTFNTLYHCAACDDSSTFNTLYHCAACEVITLSWKETWPHEKEGSGVQQVAASSQAGVFDCCVFVFIHCFSPWLHSLFIGMMDAFWNMNDEDDDDNDDKEYDDDKEEEDLFEAGEEQQSTLLIASHSLQSPCMLFPLGKQMGHLSIKPKMVAMVEGQ